MAIDLSALIGAVGVVIAIIASLLAKNANSSKKLAEKERDQAIGQKQSAEKRVEAHEKRQQIEEDIAIGDQSNVDGVRDPYDRG